MAQSTPSKMSANMMKLVGLLSEPLTKIRSSMLSLPGAASVSALFLPERPLTMSKQDTSLESKAAAAAESLPSGNVPAPEGNEWLEAENRRIAALSPEAREAEFSDP